MGTAADGWGGERSEGAWDIGEEGESLDDLAHPSRSGKWPVPLAARGQSPVPLAVGRQSRRASKAANLKCKKIGWRSGGEGFTAVTLENLRRSFGLRWDLRLCFGAAEEQDVAVFVVQLEAA
jgi:hypothetical protein